MLRVLVTAAVGWAIEAVSPSVAARLDAAASRRVFVVRAQLDAAGAALGHAASHGELRVEGHAVNARTPALASAVELRVVLSHDGTGERDESIHIVEAAQSADFSLWVQWGNAACEPAPTCRVTARLVIDMVDPSLDDTVLLRLRAIARLAQDEPLPRHEPRLAVEIEPVD